MQKLTANDLNASILLNELTFSNTAELLDNTAGYQPNIHGWVAQSEAKKSALFGLKMQQSGFNLLVLGALGSGRTSLIQSAMLDTARQVNAGPSGRYAGADRRPHRCSCR